MFEFPDWSDLGSSDNLSETTRNAWDNELMRLEQYRYYFEGDVFQEKVPSEGVPLDEQPLMFPVGLNLVKMLAIAQADAAFGEWDEQPIQFGVRQDQEVKDADVAAIELANQILDASNAPAMFWEHELDRNVFGGGAIAIKPLLHVPGHIKWSRISRECFFPIWDPDDPDELLEAFIVVHMSAEQAKAKYGYEARSDIVQRVEHWTRYAFKNYLDGVAIQTFSGVNPWGVVPFVYTPRFRLVRWWGESMTKDIIPVQDEFNMRVADVGEAINYNAHPTRWGVNLPRDFNAKNYPLGPNSMWNLGRSIGSNPPPQVGLLEAKSAVSEGVFEYINFTYDWTRVSAFAPPIAFGEDDGGGQRSGVTLEIRMWPLIKAVRRSRAYLTGSIRKALKISAIMLKQKSFSDVPARAVNSLLEGRITPKFYNIMPRDQQAVVDEVVKLLSTTPPTISLETAQAILGRGTGEVNRIRQMLDDEDLWTTPAQEKALAAQAKASQKPAAQKSGSS